MNINRVFVRLFAFVGLLMLVSAMLVCYRLNLLPPNLWWEAPSTDIVLGFGSLLAVCFYALLLHVFRVLVRRVSDAP